MSLPSEVFLLLSEWILVLGMIIYTGFLAFDHKHSLKFSSGTIFLALLLAPLAWSVPPSHLFSSLIQIYPLTHLFKFLALLLSGILSYFFSRDTRLSFKEQCTAQLFVMAGALGSLVLMQSQHLILSLISLELLSVSAFALLGLKRSPILSIEAMLKYFVLAAFSSALMIFGISYLYGAFGSLRMDIMASVLFHQPTLSFLVLIGTLLFLTAVFFKLALFPFHFWAPDVYAGISWSQLSFLALLSKLAGFALLFSFLNLFQDLPFWLRSFMWLAAVSSMLIGNFSALQQKSLKRFWAYSSIAHAGNFMVGLTVFSTEGRLAALYYFIFYMLMTAAFLWVIHILNRSGGEQESDAVLEGLFYRSPFLAVILTLILASLMGIPPLAGFMAKFLIFVEAFQKSFFVLGALGLLSSILALVYYVQWITPMFKASKDSIPVLVSLLEKSFLIFLVLLLFLGGVFVSPILEFLKSCL